MKKQSPYLESWLLSFAILVFFNTEVAASKEVNIEKLLSNVEIADNYLNERNDTQIDSRFWRSKLALFGEGKKLIKRKEKRIFESNVIQSQGSQAETEVQNLVNALIA